jgi:hypothetical protein
VIRARSLDVKLSSERGKLQVIFGEAEQPVEAARPEPAPEPTPTGSDSTAFGAAMASSESSSADNGFRAEAGSSAGDDGSWQRGGRRRGRGNRHSDPPPAVG